MKTYAIDGRPRIGPDAPCFVVAEAGSNHNGSLAMALELIEVAADARADAVKFQVFRAAKIYPRSAGQSDYLGVARPIYDIVREMELPPEWLPILAARCRERDLVFFAAPFDEASADLLAPHVGVFKIASYEMTHVPLVHHIARHGKPVIMSTGTADLEEVARAVEAFRATGNEQLCLLQCTARYPTPLDALNVRALVELRERFDLPTGLSDHSRDPIVGPMTAVALGAHTLEKHFTLSNRLPGPDHAFAIEPRELAELVRRVREVEAARGHGHKEVLAVEAELRAFGRRALYTTRAIGRGEVFTSENIAALRSGKLARGLEPAELPRVLTRRATRDLAAESSLTADDVD